MVGPVRVDGLVSGIDYASLIEKILAVQRRPSERLEAKNEQATLKKNALLELNVQLLSLKSSASILSSPRIYLGTRAASSNESLLGARASGSVSPGSYSFTPRRLAQSSQLLSNGYADADVSPVAVAAGKIRIEKGGMPVDPRTGTAYLNAQTGFDRGSIKITDTAGRTGVVDLRSATDLQEILEAVNETTSVSVRASLQGNRLVLQDQAGGGGTLRVEDVGSDRTATTLGIAGTGTVLGGERYLFGSDIQNAAGSTKLGVLNDGLGVRRNSDGIADFTITDTDGVSLAVDLQASDLTLQDAVNRINAQAAGQGSSLSASLAGSGNALVLSDSTGAQAIGVASAADSFAAADLGFGTGSAGTFVQLTAENAATGVEDAGAGNRVTGRTLLASLNSMLRDQLNGGTATASGVKGIADGSVSVTDRAGTSFTADVSRRVGTSVAVAVDSRHLTLGSVDGFAVGNRIRVQTSAGLEYRTLTEISGTTVGFDRALSGTAAAGNGVYAINDSLSDIVRTLNQSAAAAGAGVTFQVNSERNGLKVTDVTGMASSNLIVSGAVAADLGIAGSVAAGGIEGSDLDPQFLGENSLLSRMNGGDGVAKGKIRITDTQGRAFTVDLSQADDSTLGKVLSDIRGGAVAAGNLSFTARINDTGDGILLSDVSGGTGLMKVEEVSNGRTAADLNLLKVAPAASPGMIDGSFERSIDIAANSTLQEISDAINNAQAGVTATVINDGSPLAPYRLSLTGLKSGRDNRVGVDTDIPGMSFATTAEAQDALLLYGTGSAGSDPALVTSSDNTFLGVVPGLSLEARGVGTVPVTVSVSRDTEALTGQVQRFVDSYNEAVFKIKQLTGFDPDTFQTGILFGEASVRRISRDLSNLVISPVREIPAAELNALSEIGISITGEGALAFDSATFSQKLDSSFEQIQALFLKQRTLGIDTPLSDLNNGRGVSKAGGADLRIKARDGTLLDIDTTGATTVGALLSRINSAPGNNGKIEARLGSSGFTIEILDASAVELNPLSIVNLNGSTTASDLKIAKTLAAGETLLKGDILLLKGDPGVAARMEERLDFLTRAGDGLLTVRSETIEAGIKRNREEIARAEERLQKSQERLVMRFTRLESIIAQSQSTQQRLQGLLSGFGS